MRNALSVGDIFFDQSFKMGVGPFGRSTVNRDTESMNQETNPRRGRNRNNGKRNPNQNSRGRNYDNSGSDNKVRGSAKQILDKYLSLARDASLAGDRIAAEGFQQYAEHYYRVLNPEGSEGGQNTNQQERQPRHNNNQNRHKSPPAPPLNQPQVGERVEVVVTQTVPVEEPVVEREVEKVAEVSAPEPVVSDDKVVVEKPRRRGRPRKVVPSEPAV